MKEVVSLLILMKITSLMESEEIITRDIVSIN